MPRWHSLPRRVDAEGMEPTFRLSKLEQTHSRNQGLAEQALGTELRRLKAEGFEPGNTDRQETTQPFFPVKKADAALGAKGSQWNKSIREQAAVST